MFKKMMLLVLFVLFIGSLFAVSDSIKIAEKNKKYVEIIKTKAPFPLCKKVFPGVEFYVKLYLPTTPPGKTYYGKYNGKYYYLVDEYSNLFNQVKNKSNATLFERVKLLIQLNYLSRADSIKVSNLKPLEQMEKEKLKKLGIIDYDYELNYRAKVKVYNLSSWRDLDLIAYIRIKNDIIEYIRFHGENFIGDNIINPLSFFNRSIPDVAIIGGNYYHEHVEGRDYYYIEVNNNSETTGDSITFQITNLEPNEENVSIKLSTIYGHDFLDYQLLSVDNTGTAEYTWVPGNNNDTGFSNIKIDENGSVFSYATIIVPEHIMSGSFTDNYHYKIHYCNQFFSTHSGGITYAETFATYVDSALTNSWKKQVDDWRLAEGCPDDEPIDDDKIYELFVNDNKEDGLMYHNTYTNQASPSPIDRWIGIRYNSYLTQNLYSSEEMRIKVAVAHEFYHGIEFSLNAGYHGAIMDWMQEGQARLIPSVQYPSEEFIGETTQHFYPKDANEYLQNWLNKSLVINYGTSGYSDYMSFKYCLFWRFLYENYLTGFTADSLKIIRETCRGDTNSDLSAIKAFMDTKLNANGGKYHSFDEALMAFGKNIYFNDPIYNNWNPDPSNEFYNTPTIKSNHTLSADYRTSVTITANIPSSFGLDYHKIKINSGIKAATVEVVKESSSSSAELAFQMWGLKNGEIVDSTSVIIPTDSLSASYSFNAYNRVDSVVVNIIRLDPNESSTRTDANYTINVYPGTLVSGNVAGIWTIENSPYLVNGDINLTGTLTIDPGVAVYALGNYKIIIDHQNLLINGDELNPVTFSAIDTTAGWGGIRFYYSANSSINYANISHIINYSHDSYFSNPWGVNFYGAGSVFCAYSPVTFDQCNFFNNSSYAGGAIYAINQSNLNIFNCTFNNNSGSEMGGAITFLNKSNMDNAYCSPLISKSTFYENSSGFYNGGAIYFENNVNGVFVNNTITANSSTGGNNSIDGSSLYFSEGSVAWIYDSIIWKEESEPFSDPICIYDSYSNWGTGVFVYHTDLTDGQDGFAIHTDGSATGFFVPDEEVIGDNPLFADASSNDYNLQALSPCIDGGGSHTTLNNKRPMPAELAERLQRVLTSRSTDPDGTTPDMGAISYYQADYVNKPTNLTITKNESNKITLNWTEGDGAIFYDIYGSENPYSITDTLATKVRATTWQDSLYGDKRFYIVKGKNNRTSQRIIANKRKHQNR